MRPYGCGILLKPDLYFQEGSFLKDDVNHWFGTISKRAIVSLIVLYAGNGLKGLIRQTRKSIWRYTTTIPMITIWIGSVRKRRPISTGFSRTRRSWQCNFLSCLFCSVVFCMVFVARRPGHGLRDPRSVTSRLKVPVGEILECCVFYVFAWFCLPHLHRHVRTVSTQSCHYPSSLKQNIPWFLMRNFTILICIRYVYRTVPAPENV